MFLLRADKVKLSVREKEDITSGSVNVYQVRFEFSEDWNGLKKTAVFRSGLVSRSVRLNDDGETIIPWEVLESPGIYLHAGVYGEKNDNVVLPTVWVVLGMVLTGASPGESSKPPTPELWEQALSRKGDNLSLSGQTLNLRSGDRLLSSVDLPGGEEGVVPNIQATATTLPPDSPATVTRSGPDTAPAFEFGIPAGKPGKAGDPGKPGNPGDNGTTFTPSVSEEGVISWTNDGGLSNPEPVNIKGVPGAKGDPGTGVPAGGTVGQVLAKASDEDYDTKWKDPPEGGDATAYLVRAPIGTIIVWSGSVDSIPTGWALCDGQDGRPDLRGKFVLGAGGTYNPGAGGTVATGGDLAYSAQCYIIKVTADPADGVTQAELQAALAGKQDISSALTMEQVNAAIVAAAVQLPAIYSLEEQVVGRWIDGRPLYGKVVFGTWPTNGAGETPIMDDGSEISVKIYTIYGIIPGNAGIIQAPIVDDMVAENFARGYAGSDGKLHTFCRLARYNGQSYYAVVAYTKAADEATIELPAALTSATPFYASAPQSAAGARLDASGREV